MPPGPHSVYSPGSHHGHHPALVHYPGDGYGSYYPYFAQHPANHHLPSMMHPFAHGLCAQAGGYVECERRAWIQRAVLIFYARAMQKLRSELTSHPTAVCAARRVYGSPFAPTGTMPAPAQSSPHVHVHVHNGGGGHEQSMNHLGPSSHGPHAMQGHQPPSSLPSDLPPLQAPHISPSHRVPHSTNNSHPAQQQPPPSSLSNPTPPSAPPPPPPPPPVRWALAVRPDQKLEWASAAVISSLAWMRPPCQA